MRINRHEALVPTGADEGQCIFCPAKCLNRFGPQIYAGIAWRDLKMRSFLRQSNNVVGNNPATKSSKRCGSSGFSSSRGAHESNCVITKGNSTGMKREYASEAQNDS